MTLMKHRTSKILFIALLAFAVVGNINVAKAQYDVSSPYSRFGIGYTNSGKNQSMVSMGGIGYAFARNNEVNITNAASLFAIDKQTFVFNMGFDFTFRNIANAKTSSNAVVGAINNISLAFPILDRLKVGLALSPVTDINYLGSDTLFSSINSVKTFEGNGGLDRFVLALAYQPLKTKTDNLSIGASASYYFGNIYRASTLQFLTQKDSLGHVRDTAGFLDNRTETNFDVSSFGVDFGVQYFHTFGNEDILGFGLTFTPKYKLSADRRQMFYTFYTDGGITYLQDTLQYKEDDANITMPMKLGFGLSYNRPNKLFAEADFTFTKWSDFEFELQNKNSLKDNWQFNIGAEYIPNIASAAYFRRVAYRFGFRYDNGYIFLQDKRINDMAVSVGLAIPIKQIGTRVNLSFEYGRQGTTDNNLIKENYFKIGLSLSARDRWFVKRKYQ